jgi:NAD(P)-dependent dehydrogenase (short-subunit alcohol dehydrogenase family)
MLITKGFKEAIFKLNGKLDILILAHGQFAIGKMMDTLIDSFDYYLNINVRSFFHLISLATPFLKLTKGKIVAISSLESQVPVRDSFMNSLCKSMLNSLIKNTALELAGFGVNVNAVAPAITFTDFRVSEDFNEAKNKEYLERMGEFFLLNKEVIYPKDVVNSILFLSSDDSNFMTGEILPIDNGYLLNHDLSFTTMGGDESRSNI